MSLTEPELDELVLEYLKKKNYSTAAQEFQREAHVALPRMVAQVRAHGLLDFANMVSLYNEAEVGSFQKYSESYASFRSWVNHSMDPYKGELSLVLYPLFVHCYLDLVQKGQGEAATSFYQRIAPDFEAQHQAEMQKLGAVKSQVFSENEFVQQFRNNKFKVSMSSFSHELMIGYLQDKKFLLLLRLLNMYFDLKVVAGQGDGENSSGAALSNEEPRTIHWGQLQETEYLLKSNAVRHAASAEESRPKKSASKGESSQPLKKKKTQVTLETPEASDLTKSRIPIPKLKESLETLEDIRTRLALLAPSVLPSICMYTILNAHQTATSIAITKDGSHLAVGFADAYIKLWNLNYSETASGASTSSSKEVVKLIGHSGPVYDLSFAPTKGLLLSASQDNTVRLWSMDPGTNLVVYKGHNFPVWCVEFSPLGFYFATVSHDRTARVWATDHTYPLRILAGHTGDVEAVKFHPNCNYIATGSSDKSLRLWDVSSGACVRVFVTLAPVYSLAFSPDGRVLASAGEDKGISLWDLSTSKKLATFTGHKGTVWSMDFSADGALLASGAADQTVRLWDMNKGRSAINSINVPQNSSGPNPATALTSVYLGGGQAPAGNPSQVSAKPPSLPPVKTFHTKSTPVTLVRFTQRNLLLAAGAHKPPAVLPDEEVLPAKLAEVASLSLSDP